MTGLPGIQAQNFRDVADAMRGEETQLAGPAVLMGEAAGTGAATEVLRLNFLPKQVTAGGVALRQEKELNQDGYTVQSLPGGDYVVRVRHNKSGEVTIRG